MRTIPSQVMSLEAGVPALRDVDKRTPSAGGDAASGFGQHLKPEEALAFPLNEHAPDTINSIRILPLSNLVDAGIPQGKPLESATEEGAPASDGLSQPTVVATSFGIIPGVALVIPEVAMNQPRDPAQADPLPEAQARLVDRTGASSLSPGAPPAVTALAQFPPVTTSVPALFDDSAQVVSVTIMAFHRPTGAPVRPAGLSTGAKIEVTDEELLPAVERPGAEIGRSWSVADFERLTALEVPQQGAVSGRQERTPPLTITIDSSSISSPASTSSDLAAIEVDVSDGSAVAQQMTSAFETLLSGEIGGEERPGSAPTGEYLNYQPKLRVLDIVLQPQELGRVSIKMRLNGNGLSVTLEAEKSGTRQLLQQEAGSLSERLAAEGYDVESFTVQQLFVAAGSPVKELSSQAPVDAFCAAEAAGDQGKGQARGHGSDARQSHQKQHTGQSEASGLEEPNESSSGRKHLFV